MVTGNEVLRPIEEYRELNRLSELAHAPVTEHPHRVLGLDDGVPALKETLVHLVRARPRPVAIRQNILMTKMLICSVENLSHVAGHVIE